MVNRELDVLKELKDAKGFVSGEGIARKLHISRAAIWKQICKLRKEGFCIEARPRLGYRLTISPDKLVSVEIKSVLNTSYVGQEIFYYTKTESTNLIARDLALNGAKEGTLIIAEEQTRGRGRLNRNWHSPACKNILISLIFRPECRPEQVFLLTMLTSVAIVRAMKKVTGLEALIKWPNDLYMENKKIGGILTEFQGEQDKVYFVIVGVGINVNFDPFFYPDIHETSTSLYKVLGKEVSRVQLLRTILEEMEKGYDRLKEGENSQIRDEWDTFSLVKGKPVTITSFDTLEEGVAEAVDEDGCLILRDEKGRRKRIVSGDVSLRLKG